MVQLSVIIITWNARRYINDCLDSVLESSAFLSREIIIIDNASADNTCSLISSYLPNEEIVLIRNKKNLGVAKARNIGLKRASGQFIWLLDVDTKVNRPALSEMLRFIEQNPACGVTACKLTNSRGEVQQSCRRYPSFKYKAYNLLETLLSKFKAWESTRRKIAARNASQFYEEQMDGDDPFAVEYVIGACQLIRREALESVGFLDENIFYGPEDADFCLRVWQAGWTVYYLPQSRVIHEYQRMTNKRVVSRMGFIHAKALIYYFWKHKKFFCLIYCFSMLLFSKINVFFF